MSDDPKKEKIQDLEYTFEYLVEAMDRSHIDPQESPALQYLAEQVAEATSCDISKVYEGIENWMNGIRRKYG